MNRLLLAFVPALLLLLSGCATQLPREMPTRVAVPTPAGDSSGAPMRIEDTRPERSKINRLSPGVNPTKFLGDDIFAPAPVHILSAYLDKPLSGLRRDARVEFTRFDVGLIDASCNSSGPGAGWNVAGIPAGAAGYLANVLMGNAACLAASRGAGAYADIAIRIEGTEYLGVEFVQLVGLTPDQAVARAVSSAMQLLIQDLMQRS